MKASTKCILELLELVAVIDPLPPDLLQVAKGAGSYVGIRLRRHYTLYTIFCSPSQSTIVHCDPHAPEVERQRAEAVGDLVLSYLVHSATHFPCSQSSQYHCFTAHTATVLCNSATVQ